MQGEGLACWLIGQNCQTWGLSQTLSDSQHIDDDDDDDSDDSWGRGKPGKAEGASITRLILW